MKNHFRRTAPGWWVPLLTWSTWTVSITLVLRQISGEVRAFLSVLLKSIHKKTALFPSLFEIPEVMDNINKCGWNHIKQVLFLNECVGCFLFENNNCVRYFELLIGCFAYIYYRKPPEMKKQKKQNISNFVWHLLIIFLELNP